ncbi:hypothetical protein V8E53_011627 [Lactarius tabidus]
MPTRAQETNLCRSSAGAISAAARSHGIPHHPRFHLRLSRTTIFPENSALHLLRRRRADDANQARPIHAIPLLKFYHGFSISIVGIVPYTGTGFIKSDCLHAATPVPFWCRRTGVARGSWHGRTRGHCGAYILVSVRGRLPAHANWRADAACAVVTLGRDRAQYLSAWWATGFFRWIEHSIPPDRAYERSCQLCGLAGHEKAIRCARPSKSRTHARRRASQKR